MQSSITSISDIQSVQFTGRNSQMDRRNLRKAQRVGKKKRLACLGNCWKILEGRGEWNGNPERSEMKLGQKRVVTHNDRELLPGSVGRMRPWVLYL